MKNFIVLTIMTCLWALKSEAQIPNPGFEQLNQDSTVQHWFGYDTYAIGLNDSVLTDGNLLSRSTLAHSGAYALELHNAYNVTQGYGMNGNAKCNLDSSFAGFQIYFPVNNYPESLSFYYQFLQNPFTDTLVCMVNVVNSDYELLASGEVGVWDIHLGYQKKVCPLVYANPNGLTDTVPAFASIHFRNRVVVGPHVGERVLIDDVSLQGNPVSVATTTSKGLLEVYPNPASDKVWLKHIPLNTAYKILSVYGQILTQGFTSGMIDIQTLPPGLYVVQTKDGLARFMKE